jgi:hypothetical protein
LIRVTLLLWGAVIGECVSGITNSITPGLTSVYIFICPKF